MSDQRLLFRKEGRAIYISHLDLMRTFQRAFQRAGITIRHAGKFNPHPFISVAVPLSLGFSSCCELLDFGLVSGCTLEEVPEKLNAALPEGLTVLTGWDAVRPTKEAAFIRWRIELLYDNGTPDNAGEKIAALLGRESWVVSKKSKKAKSGFTEVDLAPLIRSFAVETEPDRILLTADLAAQNPGLNPNLLAESIAAECPELKTDFLRAARLDVLDGSGNRFDGEHRPEGCNQSCIVIK